MCVGNVSVLSSMDTSSKNGTWDQIYNRLNFLQFCKKSVDRGTLDYLVS